MAHHALAILREAAAAAGHKPVPLTPAVRLAIGWLLLADIAQLWQADSFAKALAGPPDGRNPYLDGYCRRRDLATTLERWTENAERLR